MSFEESMINCATGMKPSPLWKVMEKAYDENARYIHVMTDGSQVNKIPKILHQFWHGDPMPEKYKQLTEMWKQLHPEWTLMMWDEKAVADFGLANKWMYDSRMWFAMRLSIVMAGSIWTPTFLHSKSLMTCCISTSSVAL